MDVTNMASILQNFIYLYQINHDILITSMHQWFINARWL